DIAYNGLKYGEPKHVHAELDGVLKAIVDQILKNENKELTPVWHEVIDAVLDVYLGHVPEEFIYNEKKYSPVSFAAELGLNMDDNVELTSFNHHPFWKPCVLEVPDNWSFGESYNLPLDELINCIDNSITKGYSVAWACDVSEKGFFWSKGVALVPETEIAELEGLEKAKWEALTEKEREKQIYALDNVVKEKKITQVVRQKAFDNFNTQDDHGMLIVGIAKDQNGNKFYKVKNSWGVSNHIYEGYFYASEAFVRYKTTDIMVNKNSLPATVAKRLGL
ncbi:MAG: C1 family peptidase, partial [Bacteroidetes bacterium]|nr:C1 family peptidase [Bacteroidota bacterium]